MANVLGIPVLFTVVTQHSDLTPQVVALIFVFILSALTSAAETALTSVNRIRIRNMAEDGNSRAQIIESLLAKPQMFLTTILVINNVAIILASSLATVIALSFSPQWGEVFATIGTSLITLIFCEVTPKNAAVHNADSWAMYFAPVISGAAWILHPITSGLNGITSIILHIFGIAQTRSGPSVTEEELMLMVNVGEAEGILESEESDMIQSVLTLADTPIREVMVPRIDMITLSADSTIANGIDLITRVGLSRIPVYDGGIDNIVGILYAKDLLRDIRTHAQDESIRALLRPVYLVPDSKKLDDMLHELQLKRVHIAIVIDEYGSVAGLVTIEDLVEEIVGEIRDEYDIEENLIQQTGPDEYLVDARINIPDFNEQLSTEIEEDEDYDSIAGFVMKQLDKIPSQGDEVQADGVILTVLATKGNRITKLRARVEHHPEPISADSSQSEQKHARESSVQRQTGPLLA